MLEQQPEPEACEDSDDGAGIMIPAEQRMVDTSVPPDSLIGVAYMMSNVGPDILGSDPGFAAGASLAAAERLAQGFAADGSVGGPFSEQSPPPGLRVAGYLKGNTGVVWAVAGPSASVLNRVMFEILPAGDVGAMKRLLDSGTVGVGSDLRVGKGPTAGRTLLHWAVARGQRGLIKLLVDSGADTSLVDGQGQTAADLFSPSEGLPALPF